MPFGGDGICKIVEQFAEELAIFRQIDVFGIGSDDRHAQPLQRQRQIQRSLPAELDDYAVGFSVSTMFITSSSVSGSK